MRPREQPSAIVFSLIALALAALTGLLIPLSGGLGGAANLDWTPPPPTATPTPRSVQAAAAPTTIQRPTAVATATPTTTPNPSPAIAALESPSASPVRATVTAAATATTAPTAQAKAGFAVGPVNLRGGPGATFAVFGTAKPGDEFVVQGRSEDDMWVQLCCVAGAPVWASVEFVSLPAALDTFPVVR